MKQNAEMQNAEKLDPRCRAKTTHSVVTGPGFLGFAEKTPRGPYIVGQRKTGKLKDQ